MIGMRRELLDRILIVNERHLHRVITVHMSHFNAARPHRSLAQLAPAQAETRPPERSTCRLPDTPQTDPRRDHQYRSTA
jgi:hypothetical protein